MPKLTTKKPTATLLPLFVGVGLLLFGFMILVIGIDSMHMRPDEELTFRNMMLSFPQSMVRLATRNNQAPLWWMQVWLWQRLAGTTEFAGRINSILWSMLTLSTLFQLGRTWFGQRRFGWFAVAILSVNSYFFIYALEMRMYALMMFLVALSMRFFERWLSKQTWQSAVVYGLSAVLLLYTHYYLAFVILAQIVYFALFHLLKWHMVKQGFVAALTTLVVWLPGIIILYSQLTFIDFAESGGLKIPTKPTNLQSVLELAQLSSNGHLWLYSVFLLIGFLLLWRKRTFWLVLTWLIISPALVFIVNLQATIYNLRYTSFLIPAIGLGIGAIIAALPFQKFIKNKMAKVLNWLVLLAVCAISLYTLPNYIPVRVPYRYIFADVSAHYQQGDVLFTLPIYEDHYLIDQYNRYLPPDLVENRVQSVEEAQEARRVWFVTPFFLQEEAQTAFAALEPTHRVQYVTDYSECSRDYCYIAQLMVAPPYDAPIFFGDTIGFLGADIEPISDSQLPVLLWWAVDETPSADYAISLQLLNSAGELVAQLDRQIDPPGDEFGEIPTSQLQADGNYIDWRVLDLPPDLPNGEYVLQVIVYEWWEGGQRLLIPDGSDAVIIETITINR